MDLDRRALDAHITREPPELVPDPHAPFELVPVGPAGPWGAGQAWAVYDSREDAPYLVIFRGEDAQTHADHYAITRNEREAPPANRGGQHGACTACGDWHYGCPACYGRGGNTHSLEPPDLRRCSGCGAMPITTAVAHGDTHAAALLATDADR